MEIQEEGTLTRFVFSTSEVYQIDWSVPPPEPTKEVTIPAGKWGKGFLRRNRQTMCALGYAASCCGIPDNVLEGVRRLDMLPKKWFVELPEALRPHSSTSAYGDVFSCDTLLARAITQLNDESEVYPRPNAARRKQLLTRLLADAGIHVIFAD